jgi:hypothetical protein
VQRPKANVRRDITRWLEPAPLHNRIHLKWEQAHQWI